MRLRSPVKMTFIYLCILLATVITKTSGNLSIIQTAEYSGVVFQFSPDLLDDHRLVSALRFFDASEEVGLSINVSESESNATTNKCIVPFRSIIDNNPVRISQRQVRRLSRKIVLLTVRELEKNDLKLILVNTYTCKYHYAYEAVLPEKHFIFMSSNKSDESFTMIVYDKDTCGGHDWCRLFFNPFYEKTQVLNFDFTIDQFVDIQPVTMSIDENLFFVRFTDDSDIHRIRLYDVSNRSINYKELDSLPSYTNVDTSFFSTVQRLLGLSNDIPTSRYELKSSGLSYCWVLKSFHKPEMINCLLFNRNGKLLFNYTLADHTDLTDIGHIEYIPNGLVHLFTRSDCVRKDKCLVVQVRTLTNDNNMDVNDGNHLDFTSFRHREIKLASDFLVALNVRANELDGDKIDLEYLCMTEDKGLTYVLEVI